MDWYLDIKIDDIPSEKLRDVAHKNGISDAVALMRGVPGVRLYIPSLGFREHERRYVQKHYNGKNVLSISNHLRISTKKTEYLSKKQPSNRGLLSNEYIELVADRCGEIVASRLVENFHGDYIYVPRYGFSELRKQKIIIEFSGKNTTNLALKYSVSERYINKIISESLSKKHAIQMDLFQNIA